MGYDAEQQREMLIIVSRTLEMALAGKDYQPVAPEISGLDSKSGCFVTLKTGGQLRGCIGCFVSDEPLYLTLAQYGRASLLDDPRFVGRRISKDELEVVDIDISVLSPLMPCDEPESIRLGVDGIYIISNFGSGCFLPQVATETGWSVEEFWGNCCSQKAGLRYDAWRGSGVELFTFTADIVEGRYLS